MCPKVCIPSDYKPHQINNCGLCSQTKICDLGSFVFSTLNNSLTPARGSIVSSFYLWHSHSGLASNVTEFNALSVPVVKYQMRVPSLPSSAPCNVPELHSPALAFLSCFTVRELTDDIGVNNSPIISINCGDNSRSFPHSPTWKPHSLT